MNFFRGAKLWVYKSISKIIDVKKKKQPTMYSASHNSVFLELHILAVLYYVGSAVNLQREM